MQNLLAAAFTPVVRFWTHLPLRMKGLVVVSLPLLGPVLFLITLAVLDRDRGLADRQLHSRMS